MSLLSVYSSANVTVKPIPFRLRVLRALTEAIERVNPSNGYHHDLRGNVFRGRLRFGPDDPSTMVSILEAPIPPENNTAPGAAPGSLSPWELLIQGWVEEDIKNPSDPAHHLMAEVKSALVSEKRRDRGSNMLNMDGRVYEMRIGQGSVRPVEEASAEAFFWLNLTITVAEDLETPYH